MVEETAHDYTTYLAELNFPREIEPICTNIDEILTRMDEFENSLFIIKNTSATTPIPNIAECKDGFQKYFDNIDKLQVVINRINSDLTAMEESVTKAEEELGYNESGIKGFFKPFLGKVGKSDRTRNDVDSNRASGDKDTPTFVPTHVFSASDFFAGAGKSKSTGD